MSASRQTELLENAILANKIRTSSVSYLYDIAKGLSAGFDGWYEL